MNFLRFADGMPDFSDVKDDTIIYRYFSYCKLKKLFEDSSIYFCNAECFKDKRERQIPQSYYDMVEKKTSKNQSEMKKKIDDSDRNYVKSYVTCWTTESDNYAFWKIYTPNADGIMIKTTVGKLKAMFDMSKVLVTCVEYPQKTEKNNGVSRVMFAGTVKPKSIPIAEKYKIYPYNYEKEIRFIMYSKEDEKGYNYKLADLNFIEEFMISPFANDNMSSVIRNLITRYFPEAIIRTSEIEESG